MEHNALKIVMWELMKRMDLVKIARHLILSVLNVQAQHLAQTVEQSLHMTHHACRIALLIHIMIMEFAEDAALLIYIVPHVRTQHHAHHVQHQEFGIVHIVQLVVQQALLMILVSAKLVHFRYLIVIHAPPQVYA